ncbi:MAG: glycosyltransferase 61 family protein [Pseudomonadota bacterium]
MPGRPMIDGDLEITAKTLPPAHVERLQNALVLPIEKKSAMTCGVVRADGSFRHMSRTLLSGARLSGVPDVTEEPFAEMQPGRWMFAGIGRHHFGHFLVETLIRLWAAGYYRDELDGLVVIPNRGMDFSAAIDRRFGPFLSLITDGLAVHQPTHPTRYETLLLPSPGFGPLGWITGTPVFRREIRARVAARIRPQGSDKVYISRTRLQKGDKLVDQETRIEAVMRKAGYDIFYPERHSIADQLARYMTAKTLVGAEGSAFHLAPFAMPTGGRVALFQRRYWTRAFNAYPAQLEAFCEADVTSVRPLVPRKANTHSDEESPELDFAALMDGLSDAGFL